MTWLETVFSEDRAGLLTTTERKALIEAAGSNGGAKGKLKTLLSEHAWTKNETQTVTLKPILLRMVAQYLVEEKRQNDKALDSVAHFHLSNGAVIERLNWLGDASDKGLQQSAGIMINYLYDLATIDINHEAYADGGKITASSNIRDLL